MRLIFLSSLIAIIFAGTGCSSSHLIKMQVISSETQQPILGATFTLKPYQSMFQKGIQPDQPLGVSDSSGEFEYKVNTRDVLLIKSSGYYDATVGYVEHGRIGVSSPWAPSEWKGSYPAPKNFDRNQKILIPLFKK